MWDFEEWCCKHEHRGCVAADELYSCQGHSNSGADILSLVGAPYGIFVPALSSSARVT